MDRKELENKLENFKKICIKKGIIDANNNAFDLKEAYPGMKPTLFIINIHVKRQWLEGKYSATVLKELTDLLYEKTNTDVGALENILTLRLGN